MKLSGACQDRSARGSMSTRGSLAAEFNGTDLQPDWATALSHLTQANSFSNGGRRQKKRKIPHTGDTNSWRMGIIAPMKFFCILKFS